MGWENVWNNWKCLSVTRAEMRCFTCSRSIRFSDAIHTYKQQEQRQCAMTEWKFNENYVEAEHSIPHLLIHFRISDKFETFSNLFFESKEKQRRKSFVHWQKVQGKVYTMRNEILHFTTLESSSSLTLFFFWSNIKLFLSHNFAIFMWMENSISTSNLLMERLDMVRLLVPPGPPQLSRLAWFMCFWHITSPGKRRKSAFLSKREFHSSHSTATRGAPHSSNCAAMSDGVEREKN